MANLERESDHFIYYQLPNGDMAYVLTGVGVATVHTDGDDYLREALYLTLPIPDLASGKGLVVKQWAPFATLNSIANDGPDANAAWAVDSFNVSLPPLPHRPESRTEVSVECNIAVRGRGGYLLRVGYIVNLRGQILELP
jgi:hypothetical protein